MSHENTFFISSADEVENLKSQIINHKSTNPDTRVGICGATSTPQWLMEAVSERLSAF